VRKKEQWQRDILITPEEKFLRAIEPPWAVVVVKSMSGSVRISV